MQPREPSLTARAAATHRAVHQELEGGRTFHDPVALTILGADRDEIVRDAVAHPERRLMRLFIAARSRFADDTVTAAIRRGTRQLVVLGAGLDTFAYRTTYRADELTVFEVDHPVTQAWKRERLAASGLPIPATVSFVPVDFEAGSIPEALTAAGFDSGAPAIFTWLGVVPYLTQDAVLATLRFIVGVPGAEVVFDYSNPSDSLPARQREAQRARAARVAAVGEPWITYFDSERLKADLIELGFHTIEDLGPTGLSTRYFGGPPTAPRRPGGHVIRAARLDVPLPS
ncbi:MAG: SAM-dependent methyltransferase [Pseudonocardiales bacterium]|nr:MAG: SAM-dependent methyltransferase [Pseudonocardiales bacterium]